MQTEYGVPKVTANDVGKSERITLRDHYAAAALQGLIAAGNSSDVTPEQLVVIFARTSFSIADAMLEARAGKPPVTS